MRSYGYRIILALVVMLCVASTPGSASIREARRDIRALRYDTAEEELVELARSEAGAERQEALVLLAGLKRSVPEAETIYREVISIDRSSEWGHQAQLELAKIQYALGNYESAQDIIQRSGACGSTEEACYFQGLSALMLRRYPAAKEALLRVHRGRYEPWAVISLAEIEMESDDTEEACRRYRGMARSYINPTAMYRYGECLEETGDRDEAVRVFEEIIDSFKSTPEAVLAAQKLRALSGGPAREEEEPSADESEETTPASAGFTLQFGAFHDRTNAIKLAADLKGKLRGVRIDSDVVGNTEVHRVRYGYFKTRDRAQQKLEDIEHRVGESCTIMKLP